MVQITRKLILEEFLALPEGDVTYELVEGQVVPKMSPKRFHAGVQKALLILMDACFQSRGHLYPEWAVILKRNNQDWVPVPDLTYVSYDRLPADWMLDEACPVAPELVIEIISPGQTFGELTEKATDYLAAGVSGVWIVDSQARSITVFLPESLPRTYRGNTPIADLLPGIELTPQQIFQQAGLPD
jgi:Uma2 family endonuclease